MDTPTVRRVDAEVTLTGAPEVTNVNGVTFTPVTVRYDAVRVSPDEVMTTTVVYGPDFDNTSWMDPYDVAPDWVPPPPEWLVQVARDMGATGPLFARDAEQVAS